MAHFNVSKEMLGQIAQTMLEVRRLARSIENSVDALGPLSEETVDAELNRIAFSSKDIARDADHIYKLIVKEAYNA